MVFSYELHERSVEQENQMGGGKVRWQEIVMQDIVTAAVHMSQSDTDTLSGTIIQIHTDPDGGLSASSAHQVGLYVTQIAR